MQIYEVRISHGARADMAELRKFLKSMMTVEGAIRYANNMREEIKTLAFYMTRTCPLSLCHCDTKRHSRGITSAIRLHPSYILPMNVEADFIKEALDAGLFKHTTRITSSILLQTSSFVHRTMVIFHT